MACGSGDSHRDPPLYFRHRLLDLVADFWRHEIFVHKRPPEPLRVRHVASLLNERCKLAVGCLQSVQQVQRRLCLRAAEQARCLGAFAQDDCSAPQTCPT